MSEIEIVDEFGIAAELTLLIREAATAVLQHQQAAGSLTIMLADDPMLQQLNKQFRGFDKPTDVLSFSFAAEAAEMDHYLGDIAISIPRAQAQAKEGGHPVAAELQLLAVHGVLHLLGHDHADPVEKRVMWDAQAAVLTMLQAGIIAPVIGDE